MEPWYYDESRQVGIDFSSEDEVRDYDNKYKAVRNIDQEADLIFESLKLHPGSVILEFGTGTGEHAVRLARRCAEVTACDVSQAMLQYAQNKSRRLGISNITFINAGFLNPDLPDAKYDAVISQLALHHLPEFWKSVAVDNVRRILKPGGFFYLLDSILSFDIASYKRAVGATLEFARTRMGEKIAEEIMINIRDEYPAYDWSIEHLLTSCGFRIDKKIKYTAVMSLYVAVKE